MKQPLAPMTRTLSLNRFAVAACLLAFFAAPSYAAFLCLEKKVEKVIVNLSNQQTEVSDSRRGTVWQLKESYNGWAVFTDGNKDPRFEACQRQFEPDSGFLLGLSCAMDGSRYDARSNLFYSPEGLFAVQIWSLPVGDYQTVTRISGSCTVD